MPEGRGTCRQKYFFLSKTGGRPVLCFVKCSRVSDGLSWKLRFCFFSILYEFYKVGVACIGRFRRRLAGRGRTEGGTEKSKAATDFRKVLTVFSKVRSGTGGKAAGGGPEGDENKAGSRCGDGLPALLRQR